MPSKFILKESDNDIKGDYRNLLAQIAYAPMNKLKPNKPIPKLQKQNNTELKQNKVRFWDDWHIIEDKDTPLLKVVYKPIGIISQ